MEKSGILNNKLFEYKDIIRQAKGVIEVKEKILELAQNCDNDGFITIMIDITE